MAPKVLISDALSPAAVQIFKDRGIEVDFQPALGKDKDKLAEIIGNYDGLAIRSATKVTAKMLEKAAKLKVIGRAGIGVDNVEIPAATAKGIIVMNTPFGNSITTAEHAITLMLSLAREIPQADASTQAGQTTVSTFQHHLLRTQGLLPEDRRDFRVLPQQTTERIDVARTSILGANELPLGPVGAAQHQDQTQGDDRNPAWTGQRRDQDARDDHQQPDNEHGAPLHHLKQIAERAGLEIGKRVRESHQVAEVGMQSVLVNAPGSFRVHGKSD